MLNKQYGKRVLESLLWILPAFLSLIPSNNFFLKTILCIYYLLVPGLLALVLLGGKAKRKFEPIHFVQAVGLSLAYLMFVGALTNALLPLLSFTHPLNKGPFVVVFALSLYAMALASYSRLGAVTVLRRLTNSWSWPTISKPNIVLPVLGFIFIAAAIFGTIVLNNGGPNYLTVAALIMLAGATMYCFTSQNKFSTPSLLIFLYLVSLGLLVMYSLRSQHILGFDITKEYHVFQLTQSSGRWQLSKYADPYNACLSITVLPTLLSNLLHISGEYVFKFLYQMIFALVPVTMYLLYRKLFSRAVALLGVFIFVFQLYYAQQLPALARQEIAFLFLALILEFLLVSTRKRLVSPLLFILSFALIVSHYSTAYFWMFTLISFYIVYFIAKVLFGHKIKIAHRLSPLYLIIFVLAVVLWFGQLTTTSSNLAQFVTKLPNSFSSLLSSDSLENDVGKLRGQTANVNTQQNLNTVYRQTTNQSKNYGNHTSLINAPNYQPQLHFSRSDAGIITGVIGTICGLVLSVVYVGVTYVLETLGLIWVLAKQKRYQGLLTLELLTLACIPLVALIVAVPTIAVDYNLSRAYMQLLLLFAPFAAIGITRLCALIHLPKADFATGALLVLFLFFTSGLSYLVFGGSAYVTLQNYGYDYDKFYTTNADMNAASWLGRNYNSNLPVYTDEYGQLKLQAYTTISHYRSKLFLNQIDTGSYVYLDTTNTARGTAFTTFGNQEVEYMVPQGSLQNAKSTIYASQDVNVLR